MIPLLLKIEDRSKGQKDVNLRGRKELKWSNKRQDENDLIPVNLKSFPCGVSSVTPGGSGTTAGVPTTSRRL